MLMLFHFMAKNTHKYYTIVIYIFYIKKLKNN